MNVIKKLALAQKPSSAGEKAAPAAKCVLLESLEDRNEACYMVTEIAESILVEKSDVISKLNYIQRAVAQAHQIGRAHV